MNEELKNCPFCGGKAKINTPVRKGNGGCDLFAWQISCDTCGISTKYYEDEAVRDEEGIRLTEDGREKAIKIWNMRRGCRCQKEN